MTPRVRVWLDGDTATMHHAEAIDDLSARGFDGRTDCGRQGALILVHLEAVDTGRLCEDCQAVTGVRPPLAGADLGPV